MSRWAPGVARGSSKQWPANKCHEAHQTQDETWKGYGAMAYSGLTVDVVSQYKVYRAFLEWPSW